VISDEAVVGYEFDSKSAETFVAAEEAPAHR
jgi:hypothetical protein